MPLSGSGTIYRNNAARALLIAGVSLLGLSVLIFIVTGGAPNFHQTAVAMALFLVGGVFAAGHLVIRGLRYSDKEH